MVKIFISYSHVDVGFSEDLQKALVQLVRNGHIEIWTDSNITPGRPWDEEIRNRLQTTDIILLLVSSDYLHSKYSYEVEVNAAMERHAAGKSTVIPIILRPCDWPDTPFGKLQALPTNGTAVSIWINKDQAFLNIVEGIKRKIALTDTEIKGGTLEPRPPSLKKRLAGIRMQYLGTTDIHALKKLLFEIKQLEEEGNSDFELDELKEKIKESIQYASKPPPRYIAPSYQHRSYFSRVISAAWQTNHSRIILVAVGLIVLIMFLSYLYWFA